MNNTQITSAVAQPCQAGCAASLRNKMLAVIADVNRELVEREELVELIAVALLTRKNLFILGKPGQAKSYAINLFRRHITGARQFERLLSKQTDEDQLFGRIDLSSLIPGAIPESALAGDPIYEELRSNLQDALGQLQGCPSTLELLDTATQRLEHYVKARAALHSKEPVVQTAGKIPEADIVFLDEMFKANDGVLNSLLTALNERKYTNEGHTYAIPAISFFAASNEIPCFSDPQEKILEALYDRLELKIVTEDIADRANRLAVLKNKQTGTANQIHASITLEDLVAMQQEVASVPVSDAINQLADDILYELRKNGLALSDRKYLGYYPLAQAKAWLSGHAAVTPQDLLILKSYLWQKPGECPMVEATLNRLCINPLQDKANNIQAMAQEAKEAFDAVLSNAEAPKAAPKALIKLRGELVRLYGMQQELAAAAQSENETALVTALLADLEKINRDAHKAVKFTHTPLEQLSALQ